VFYREPFESVADNRVEILRVPPGPKVLEVVCLADGWTGIYVHYVGGRCVACPNPQACGCKTDTAARWRGYIPVTGRKVQRVYLLEFTPGALGSFRDRAHEVGGLRGEIVELRRRGDKPNGALVAHFLRETLADRALPTFTETETVLRRIYEMRPDDLPAADVRRGRSANRVFSDRNGRGE